MKILRIVGIFFLIFGIFFFTQRITGHVVKIPNNIINGPVELIVIIFSFMFLTISMLKTEREKKKYFAVFSNPNIEVKYIKDILSNYPCDIEEVGSDYVTISLKQNPESTMRNLYGNFPNMIDYIQEYSGGSWNKWGSPTHKMEKSKNLKELLDNIDKIGSIKSGEKEYSSEELKKAVKGVFYEDMDFDYVTRSYGLRKKVFELKFSDSSEIDSVTKWSRQYIMGPALRRIERFLDEGRADRASIYDAIEEIKREAAKKGYRLEIKLVPRGTISDQNPGNYGKWYEEKDKILIEKGLSTRRTLRELAHEFSAFKIGKWFGGKDKIPRPGGRYLTHIIDDILIGKL